MIELSVNETKWCSLLASTRAFIRYISIRIFDFGPVKLPGRSRNGPLAWKEAENGERDWGRRFARRTLTPRFSDFKKKET